MSLVPQLLSMTFSLVFKLILHYDSSSPKSTWKSVPLWKPTLILAIMLVIISSQSDNSKYTVTDWWWFIGIKNLKLGISLKMGLQIILNNVSGENFRFETFSSQIFVETFQIRVYLFSRADWHSSEPDGPRFSDWEFLEHLEYQFPMVRWQNVRPFIFYAFVDNLIS